jgi:putative transposase
VPAWNRSRLNLHQHVQVHGSLPQLSKDSLVGQRIWFPFEVQGLDGVMDVSKGQHTVNAAAIRQAFDQPDRKHARETWQRVADQLRPRWPKLADLMDTSEHDVLAYMAFPRQHRTKLHSTNPLERLNKEVKRRADVVGIFPNQASIMRLIGAVLFEQNDEWQTSSRYMMVEAFAQIDKEESDPILSITTKVA